MDKESLLNFLKAQQSAELFPSLYEGFKEVEALAIAEDYIAEILKKCVYTAIEDKAVTTAGEAKLAQWEEITGTSASGTIEERRAAVLEALGKNYAFNDNALAQLVTQIAKGAAVEIETDCGKQEINITQKAEDAAGTSPGCSEGALPTRIASQILGDVPQALSVYGKTITTTEKEIILNHSTTTTIYTSTKG